MALGAVYAEQFIDADGNVLAGGLLYTYLAGTSTYQPVYSDNGLTTPVGQPVVLDPNGRCQFYVSSVSYKFVIQKSDGSDYDTIDNYRIPSPGEGATTPMPDWVPTLTW